MLETPWENSKKFPTLVLSRPQNLQEHVIQVSFGIKRKDKINPSPTTCIRLTTQTLIAINSGIILVDGSWENVTRWWDGLCLVAVARLRPGYKKWVNTENCPVHSWTQWLIQGTQCHGHLARIVVG